MGWLLCLATLVAGHGPAAADAGAASAAGRANAIAPAEDPLAVALERQDFTTAIALLRARLEVSPADAELKFALARALAWSGDYAAAVAEYDDLQTAYPDNADYAFGRAQTLAWAGRPEAALQELEHARTLAPDYEDVWRLEHALLARRGDTDPRLQSLRKQAARRFPAATWWHETAPVGSARASLRFTAGTVQESLSTAVPDWGSEFVNVSRRGESGGFYASVSREKRFAASDTVVAGGVDWRASERWTLGLDLGLGPGADFMPRRSAGVWALRAWPRAFETQFRLRFRDYRATEVGMSGVTLAKYFGDFRAAWSVDRAELAGAPASLSHSASLSYYRSQRTQFILNVVNGREAETIGPGQVLRIDVSGLSAGATHALGERFSLAWWLGSIRQGDFYRRRYVGVSLTADL
jgi:YaiO family outer membrane protein